MKNHESYNMSSASKTVTVILCLFLFSIAQYLFVEKLNSRQGGSNPNPKDEPISRVLEISVEQPFFYSAVIHEQSGVQFDRQLVENWRVRTKSSWAITPFFVYFEHFRTSEMSLL